MPRYGIKALIYIAENYEDFEPSLSYGDSVWGSSRWTDLLDTKIDFDRALKQLAPGERKLVFDSNTTLVGERYRIFRVMKDFLAKPPCLKPRRGP